MVYEFCQQERVNHAVFENAIFDISEFADAMVVFGNSILDLSFAALRRDRFCGQPGATLASLGSSLGVTLGHFQVRVIWGHSGGTLGSLWVVGRVWVIWGYSKGTLGISLRQSIAFHEDQPKVWEGCSKTDILVTKRISQISQIRRILAETLPSTRASARMT